MDIEVRLAKKGDIDIIHGILEEIQPCDIKQRARRFDQAIDSNFSTYLVAVSGEKVIGFVNIWHIPDIVDGGILGIILDCYVSKEHRHRGVGKMLMNSANEIWKKIGVNKSFGWMNPNNKNAISLLKKLGYSTESLMLEKNMG